MSDVFKPLYQDRSNKKYFGICDDIPHQRAYLDEIDGQKWTAVVHNDHEQEIAFTALDNCIEFNKANGHKESRCEGVLTHNETIIFVEIKERKGDASSWAKKADAQLRNSIAIVETRISLASFTTKKAYICNRLQRNTNESHSVRAKKFLEDTGYILRVENRVKIA